MAYHLHANRFYRRVVANGRKTFVVVSKPAGVVALTAWPSDFEPIQAGALAHFRLRGRHYVT